MSPGSRSAKKLKIAVLLSGTGGTLKNLLAHIDSGDIPGEIACVVSSRDGVKGLTIASDAGIRTEVIRAKDFIMDGREAERIVDWRAMSRALDGILLPGGYDLICMAGFLSRYYLPNELNGRVMNIHPSLIPMFCGEGMYGSKVHRAVIAAGVKISGCTVHFVNNEYDAGPIILQRACPVYFDDTPETLAERVFAEECKAYPDAIRLFAEGRVRLSSDSRVFIKKDDTIARFS